MKFLRRSFSQTIHASQRSCLVLNLGFQDYHDVWMVQKGLLELLSQQRKINKSTFDFLIVTQHQSTYTIGKGGSVHNIKVPIEKSPIYRIERGGEITWHGPGQLIAYPILDLNFHKKDLRWYVSQLEESVIQSLARFQIEAGRSEVNPGVWVQDNKICAVGIAASRWITMHGICFNLNCDLAAYQPIVPCGITTPNKGVTNLIEEIRKKNKEINAHLFQATPSQSTDPSTPTPISSSAAASCPRCYLTQSPASSPLTSSSSSSSSILSRVRSSWLDSFSSLFQTKLIQLSPSPSESTHSISSTASSFSSNNSFESFFSTLLTPTSTSSSPTLSSTPTSLSSPTSSSTSFSLTPLTDLTCSSPLSTDQFQSLKSSLLSLFPQLTNEKLDHIHFSG